MPWPDAVAEDFAQDIVLMKQTGMEPVVVHGGGPQIGAMLKKLGIPSTFIDGLRVTDEAAMEVVEMVLTGTINKQIVTGINAAGGRAVGLSGKDGNLVVARKLELKDRSQTPAREADRPGFRGRARADQSRGAAHHHESEIIPVIAPVGVGQARARPSTSMPTRWPVRSRRACKAERLILLTDVEGVLDQDRKLIPQLTLGEARTLIANGTISGGMIPKIETAIEAVESGVNAAVILDGRIPHVLLLELFTQHGAGTLITAE